MVTILSRPPSIHTRILLPSKDAAEVSIQPLRKSMDQYLSEVRDLFSPSFDSSVLYSLSSQLQSELKAMLQFSDISMLPSYHHTLPSGSETGTFLALDVGGSNFRIALIDLNGSQYVSEEEQTVVRHCLCFPIDSSVRALRGKAFFGWMADRIQETLSASHYSSTTSSKPLAMGMAWSFPIEQTSARSGRLLTMGKGFSSTVGVQGQDLCELIMEPCRERGLNVQLSTIVNDSSASLLSQAYREPTTRMSLILGTGTNSSIYLPVTALSKSKLGDRPREWHEAAKHVIVNTELSMHGKDVWPKLKWDKHLNDTHQMPDFQPFEHFVGGRYLGEIVRLILIDAIQEAGFLDGHVPQQLDEPYALETSMLAAFECEKSPSLAQAGKEFSTRHPSSRSLTANESLFIKELAVLVSTRAAAYEAAAIHALWVLSNQSEVEQNSLHLVNGDRVKQNGLVHGPADNDRKVTIACNGSVLEKYPTFRKRCQKYLDELTHLTTLRGKEGSNGPENHELSSIHRETDGESSRLIELRMARESSMFGAAIAAARCGDD